MISIPSDGCLSGRAIRSFRGTEGSVLADNSDSSGLGISTALDSVIAMTSTGVFRARLIHYTDALMSVSRISVKRDAIHTFFEA
jgi:hypothetical protein